jgi:hypothetical protein
MKARTTVFVLLTAAALLMAAGAASGQSPAGSKQGIYGSQLMTERERNEYRERMRTAKTEQDREQLRREHHAQMQARARERGVTLPDEPPARGGQGYGAGGPGGGMGSGGGMGGGSGRGR